MSHSPCPARLIACRMNPWKGMEPLDAISMYTGGGHMVCSEVTVCRWFYTGYSHWKVQNTSDVPVMY
jgi:hypothetical protein